MEYVTFTKTDSGDLEIRLTAEGREELAELHPMDRGDQVFFDLCEYHLCNGWDLISPEDIGAFTVNPYMLSDERVYGDPDGDLVAVGTVYYFDAYAIRSPLDDLERDGFVVFKGYAE
jgi:hypothetical protein